MVNDTSSSTLSYWLDGGVNANAQTSYDSVSNCYQSYLGKDFSKINYKGYVSELIMFKKALTTEERQAIETYLKGKQLL